MSTKVCGNCNIKHSSAELSGPQSLCKECRRSLPQAQCAFCQIDFFVTKECNKNKPACKKCSEYFNKFGDPKTCDWCRNPSAFKGSKCFQCKSQEEKYGKPSRCEGCKNTAYFDKGLEAKKKVDNKCLCLLCTLKYKKELHRRGKFKRSSAEIVGSEKSRKTKADGDASSASAANRHPRSKMITAHTGVQCDLCGHGGVEKGDNAMEAIVLTTQLKEEIAQLKRQLDTRDRSLIEKGKQFNELRTEKWEVEKEFKKRLQDQHLEYEKRLENMENMIRDIKSQNGKLNKMLKTTTRKSVTAHTGSALLMDTTAVDSS